MCENLIKVVSAIALESPTFLMKCSMGLEVSWGTMYRSVHGHLSGGDSTSGNPATYVKFCSSHARELFHPQKMQAKRYMMLDRFSFNITGVGGPLWRVWLATALKKFRMHFLAWYVMFNICARMHCDGSSIAQTVGESIVPWDTYIWLFRLAINIMDHADGADTWIDAAILMLSRKDRLEESMHLARFSFITYS